MSEKITSTNGTNGPLRWARGTSPVDRGSSGSTMTLPTLTDSAERALLTAQEQRIAQPLPLPSPRTVARWFAGLMPKDRRAHRLVQLEGGLVLFGISDAFMLMSGLGATPWDVLHQGLSRHLGLAVGTMVILVGAAVMLLWIPLRQRPGFGTMSNVVVIGLAMNATMAWLATPHALWLRWTVLLAGLGLNGLATGAYIGAGLGPGPRDGLMTGLVVRTGLSVRLVRTTIEATVLAVGWLLGGTVGVGTVLYAFGIGPLIQLFLRLTPKRVLAVSGWASVAEAGRRRVESSVAEASDLEVKSGDRRRFSRRSRESREYCDAV
jgi:uncharacterized membrane protein YczE